MKKYKHINSNIKLVNSIILCICLLLSPACNDDNTVEEPAEIGADWTIMIYGDADNNIEEYLLHDINEMKFSFVNNQGHNLIVLVDRVSGYTDSAAGFGENFTDTRLYRITNGKTTRINGGSNFPEITTTSSYEANMGDASVLKKFIKSCKENYPANKYALILWNHGNGPMKKRSNILNMNVNKGICEDVTSNGDQLFIAEISDTLEDTESVNLLAFDACLMGSVEVAYQYRPGNSGFNADVMVASPPEVWGAGYSYNGILERIRSGEGYSQQTDTVTGAEDDFIYEKYYDPKTMTALELGGVIVEEQYDSLQEYIDIAPSQTTSQAMSCYDLSYIDEVKTAVDTLAVSLSTNNEKSGLELTRGSYSLYDYDSSPTIHYFDALRDDFWIMTPLFDIYDLCYKIKNDNNFHDDITGTNGFADNVMEAVNNLIVYSFAGSDFTGFESGKNGISIFFPDGDRNYNDPVNGTKTHWEYQWWYNSIDTNTENSYGKLDWCKYDMNKNAAININIVENWFEMLDSWFDSTNDSSGGDNYYQW